MYYFYYNIIYFIIDGDFIQLCKIEEIYYKNIMVINIQEYTYTDV